LRKQCFCCDFPWNAFCFSSWRRHFEGEKIMRALCWHGKRDVRVDTMPDRKIQHPCDAVIKITACAICGSDLQKAATSSVMRTWATWSSSGPRSRTSRSAIGSWSPSSLAAVSAGSAKRGCFRAAPHESQCRNRGQGDGTIARRPVRIQPYARRLFRGPGGISPSTIYLQMQARD
jgi:hypothetical protein